MTPVKYSHTLNREARTRSVAALTRLGRLPRGAAQRARTDHTCACTEQKNRGSNTTQSQRVGIRFRNSREESFLIKLK